MQCRHRIIWPVFFCFFFSLSLFSFGCHTLPLTQPWNTIPLCHLHKLVKPFFSLQVSVTLPGKMLLLQSLWGGTRGFLCWEKNSASHVRVTNADKCNKLSPYGLEVNQYLLINLNDCSGIQACVYVEQDLKGPRCLFTFPFHAAAPFWFGEINSADIWQAVWFRGTAPLLLV